MVVQVVNDKLKEKKKSGVGGWGEVGIKKKYAKPDSINTQNGKLKVVTSFHNHWDKQSSTITLFTGTYIITIQNTGVSINPYGSATIVVDLGFL